MVSSTLNDSSDATTYLQRFIAGAIGYNLPLENIDQAFAEDCFNDLTRQEELNIKWRDQWGNWDWPFSEAHRRGEIYIPRLDNLLNNLRSKLENIKSPLPHWPDGKSFALCLTHDVDEINPHNNLRTGLRRAALLRKTDNKWTVVLKSYLRAILNSAFKQKQINTLTSRTIDDWLEVEDQHNFKSTFFIFPDNTIRPNQWDCTYRLKDKIVFKANTITLTRAISEIDKLGWEIGLHASYHSATDNGILKDEKRQLEQTLNKAVISLRQHYLHYDITTTPGLQSDAGFRVDSTLGFNRAVGFRSGTSFPHWCWDHQNQKLLPILEIPQIIMDTALFHPNSLEYNQDLAINHCKQIMETVRKFGGCLTLNWHHDYINNDLYWDTYGIILNEAARQGAWGCSAAMLFNWWVEREKKIFEP